MLHGCLCHHGMAHLQVTDGGDSLEKYRVSGYVLNRHLWRANKGWSFSLWLGEGLTTPHCKKTACYEVLHGDSDLVGCCEHGNGLLGSIKGGEFLDQLSDLASQEGICCM
jgi:hypothetical protein